MRPEHVCRIDQRRTYERPHVCDACRHWQDQLLAAIPGLVHRLQHPEPAPDTPWTVTQYRLVKGVLRPVEAPGYDPIAAALPGGLIHSTGLTPRVTGSTDTATPVNLDHTDLTSRAHRLQASDAAREHPEDHIGQIPVANHLAIIAGDWWETGFSDHTPPAPTIAALTTWMRNRLDWACDNHPAIADQAEEIKELNTTLRAAAGDFPARPTLCDGVACKRCDNRTLFRKPPWVECDTCGLLYSDQEYEAWIRLLAAAARAAKVKPNTPK